MESIFNLTLSLKNFALKLSKHLNIKVVMLLDSARIMRKPTNKLKNRDGAVGYICCGNWIATETTKRLEWM